MQNEGYKSCFIPSCKSNTITAPFKKFIRLSSSQKEVLTMWNRFTEQSTKKLPKRFVFCCEDHSSILLQANLYSPFSENKALEQTYGFGRTLFRHLCSAKVLLDKHVVYKYLKTKKNVLTFKKEMIKDVENIVNSYNSARVLIKEELMLSDIDFGYYSSSIEITSQAQAANINDCDNDSIDNIEILEQGIDLKPEIENSECFSYFEKVGSESITRLENTLESNHLMNQQMISDINQIENNSSDVSFDPLFMKKSSIFQTRESEINKFRNCRECGREFQNHINLTEHAQVCKVQFFRCRFCDTKVEGLYFLKDHLQNLHASAISPAKTFNYEKLLLQMKEFRDDPLADVFHNALYCVKCNITLDYYENQDGKIFDNSTNCPRCGLVFHYKCKKCKRLFVHHQSLKRHFILVCSKKLYFNCSDCSYETTSKKKIEEHKKISHSKRNRKEISKQERLRCNLCDFKACCKMILQTHNLSEHEST